MRQPEFVPSWLLLIALLIGLAVCVYVHVADPHRERPADWDPYRWRAWIQRQDFWLGTSSWRSVVLRMRGTQPTTRTRHVRRRAEHSDLDRAITQLEDALQRNDGRIT